VVVVVGGPFLIFRGRLRIRGRTRSAAERPAAPALSLATGPLLRIDYRAGLREVPVHKLLARLLAEWKLRGWPELMGWKPGPDDLIVPSREGRHRNVNHTLKRFHQSAITDMREPLCSPFYGRL
jgi:hypothetical protein